MLGQQIYRYSESSRVHYMIKADGFVMSGRSRDASHGKAGEEKDAQVEMHAE